MEQSLTSWTQEGRASIWRYRKAPRMYGGWHFTADEAGCASLIRLCNILEGATEPAHRTVSVTDAQEVGADRIFGDHNLRLDVPAKIRLGNDLEGTRSIGLEADVFALPLSREDISSFAKAVRDLAADHADFGVGFGKNHTIVNFWWWPRQR